MNALSAYSVQSAYESWAALCWRKVYAACTCWKWFGPQKSVDLRTVWCWNCQRAFSIGEQRRHYFLCWKPSFHIGHWSRSFCLEISLERLWPNQCLQFSSVFTSSTHFSCDYYFSSFVVYFPLFSFIHLFSSSISFSSFTCLSLLIFLHSLTDLLLPLPCIFPHCLPFLIISLFCLIKFTSFLKPKRKSSFWRESEWEETKIWWISHISREREALGAFEGEAATVLPAS